MPTTEAYRPGLLSSLLLGKVAGGDSGPIAQDDAVSGTAQPASTVVDSTTKKKTRSKKKNKSQDGEPSSPAAASDVEKAGEDRSVAAAAPPAEGVAGLASLFSPSNINKFKRRERVDKEADAVEVARITAEARARERKEEEEAANGGKKKNKKAKKREQEELENRRKLEAEKRLEIAAKRTAALVAAAEAVGVVGPTKEEAGSNGSSEEEAEEDEGEEDEDEEDDERDSDSEPESVVAGNGGDSSDEEMDDLDKKEAGGRKQEKKGIDKGSGVADKAEGTVPSAMGEQVERKGAGDSKGKALSSKEQGGDEKEARTIFVGNLPISFTPKKVKSAFKEYGAVESVRLRSVAVQGMAVDKAGDQQLVRKVCVNKGMVDEEVKSSVNAYVVYKDKASVEKALAANGSDVGGKHVRVDRAESGEYDHARSVFLGNLPMDANEEEVRELFCSKLEGGATAVEGIRLVRDNATLIGKGFGYVLLADRALAAAALAVQGTKLRGRPLRVMPCGKRTKGRRGVAKPGLEDHKFASFEGRRTTDVGVLRRLKRKMEGADGVEVEVGKRNRSTAPDSTSGGRSGGRGGGGRGGGGGGSNSAFKKPRWTTEEGVRAGKGAGGRAPPRAAVVPSPGGRGRGRGRSPAGRGRGRGSSSGASPRGRGLGSPRGRGSGRGRGRGRGRG